MKPGNAKSSPPITPGPMDWAGRATPDRRLASLFTKRSTTAPAVVTSIGILSTHPSAQSGTTAFTAALGVALRAQAPQMATTVVRAAPGQRGESDEHEAEENRTAARALNSYDIAVIQHDHGINGGEDSDRVLAILNWVRVPVVLVVHSLLAEPTEHQRQVLAKLTESADAVVAMSQAGRQRLLDNYRVEPRKLLLIPHGGHAHGTARRAGKAPRPTLLTWGLLGPGKGIEWGIDALPTMSMLRPRPRYVVAGLTHPEVFARIGEGYRSSLAQRAESQGVRHLVEFEPGYIGPERLQELLGEADVVLLPYESHDQVTSGVLIEAIAAQVPVVATAFPHAVEMLGDGLGGTLVPHGEPEAIAAAVIRILAEPGVAAAMSAHNATYTDLVSWPNVASQYRQLFNALLRRPSALSR